MLLLDLGLPAPVPSSADWQGVLVVIVFLAGAILLVGKVWRTLGPLLARLQALASLAEHELQPNHGRSMKDSIRQAREQAEAARLAAERTRDETVQARAEASAAQQSAERARTEIAEEIRRQVVEHEDRWHMATTYDPGRSRQGRRSEGDDSDG